MKSIVALIFLLLSFPDSAFSYTVVTQASTLNMRSAPNRSGAVVTKLPNQSRLTVLTRNDTLDPAKIWFKVSTSSGSIGWVKGSFTKYARSGSGPEPFNDFPSTAPSYDSFESGNDGSQFSDPIDGGGEALPVIEDEPVEAIDAATDDFIDDATDAAADGEVDIQEQDVEPLDDFDDDIPDIEILDSDIPEL